MAKPRKPRVLCVPINAEIAGKSASSAVIGARNAVRGYRRAKRRQLNKARGQLAKLGGLSVQAQASVNFRKSQNLQGGGLTLPYRLVQAAEIDRQFVSAVNGGKLDTTFIKELFGSAMAAHAVVYINRGSSSHESAYNRSAVTGAQLTQIIQDAVYNTVQPGKGEDGSWLLFFGSMSGHVPSALNVLCVRFGDQPGDVRRATSSGFDLAKLVDKGPIRVVFSTSFDLTLGVNNQWRYFNIPAGVSPVDPTRISQTLDTAAQVVTESAFTSAPVPERPYGPDFNAIRPPGTELDYPYALLAGGISAVDVLRFYNKLLREAWSTIHDGLQGAQRDLFERYYPTARSLMLPRGAFDTTSASLWLRTAAIANAVYDVLPLSFDMRSDASGQPNTSIVDPGPLGQERGLLANGKTLVDTKHMPLGGKFDNRVGSLVISHGDESFNLQDVAIAPLSGRSNDLDSYPGNLAKLEYVVRNRVKHAAQIMYGPYNDYATIASLFRAELGDYVYSAYRHDQADMLNAITSDLINANIPNAIFKETWGTLAIRVVMGARYSDIDELPKFEGSTEPPDNSDRLLPFKAPSAPDKIAVYSDLYDPNVNGAEIRNYSRMDVHGFDFGDRALFRVVPAKRIVIHWGGTQNGWRALDGGAIAAMLSNTRHSPSTHFTLSHDGAIVRQHAELAATTGHAGGFNFDSVGVDIPNIGPLFRKYKSTVTTGYTSVGYTLIDAPLYRSETSKMFIGPIGQYETLFALIQALCALRNTPPGIHTDQLQFDPEPRGIIDVGGKAAVVVSSMVGAKYSDDFNAEQRVGGVYAHLHLASNGKTDGIDGHIYYALRFKLGDTDQDAYRRMKLTLQGDVKQTPDGVRYLTLDRS